MMKKRIDRVLKLLRMDGNVGERIGTGIFIIGGFIVGLWIGRLILQII
jgi:hypothetical protein